MSYKVVGGVPAGFPRRGVKVFRVYFYEKGGSRNFTMTLGMKDVNEARRM